jgi:hypothetical protein
MVLTPEFQKVNVGQKDLAPNNAGLFRLAAVQTATSLNSPLYETLASKNT